MKKTVVLYPFIGVGHLIPMVQLGKLFLRRGFAVAVAVIKPAVSSPVADEAVARLAVTNPSIAFHALPAVDVADPSDDLFMRNIQTIRLNNPGLAGLLRLLQGVVALVVDMFCTDGFDAATEAGVPGYLYFTSAAACLGAILHFTYLHDTAAGEMKDMEKDALIRVGGLPPLRVSDIPRTMHDRGKDAYWARMHPFLRFIEARGVLINSFEWLEANALKAVREGACLPHRSTPPVFCVGPLVDRGGDDGVDPDRHPSLRWLDAQPYGSVVFLSFGSIGSFSVEQIKEIAVGLEKSRQRFLWVVRTPAVDAGDLNAARTEPDLDVLLPEGFLERTMDVGMVVKSWAPQAAVLRHKAVGAFVTHCGWNSALEAVITGLPMVCWPQYAEQLMNKVFIVEEMKLGIEMRGYDESIVTAEEIEEKVRWVMEPKEANELRWRAAEAKAKAAAAVEIGGSSDLAFDEFIAGLELPRV